jgi:hypothetical protein
MISTPLTGSSNSKAITLHYSIYNGISLFPTKTRDALNKDNKAVVDLANLIEAKLFNQEAKRKIA